MGASLNEIDVYLEIGKKRTFAGASEWPGWCRSGRDESSALRALFEYGPRYARLLHETQLGFLAPAGAGLFRVVERLPGDATTDFGAPGASPSSDSQPVDDADLRRFQELLQACWRGFDAALVAAAGRDLRKGPRGGGRDQQRVLEHVLGSEAGYLSSLGVKVKYGDAAGSAEKLEQIRRAILEGLAAAARGEIEARGPRGGLRWTPRYFVRRVAWHILDHAWEIEDRII